MVYYYLTEDLSDRKIVENSTYDDGGGEYPISVIGPMCNAVYDNINKT